MSNLLARKLETVHSQLETEVCAESLGTGHTGLLSSQVTDENRAVLHRCASQRQTAQMADVSEMLDLRRLLRLSSGSVLWVLWTGCFLYKAVLVLRKYV